MTGNNSITINQATLIEAMQCWLDTQFAESARVKVSSVKDHAAYGALSVTVEFSPPEKQP